MKAPMKLDGIKSIAKDMSLSIHTLRKFCRQGLPHYRVGKKILIDRSVFEAWFESRFGSSAVASDLDTVVKEIFSRFD